MDSQLDKAMIVNWALAELGLAPSFSIDDGTQTGRQVSIFWPRALAQCFALTDWWFLRRTFQLARMAEPPAAAYRYQYELPGERIGSPVAFFRDARLRDRIRDFRLEAGAMLTNEDTVFATVLLALDPRDWDIAFANAFAVALASLLAVPLLQDAELAADKARMAFGTPQEGGTGGLFGRLVAQNRAASPHEPVYMRDPLTDDRISGIWWR